MKIDRPTPDELKDLYNNNRTYFNTLSEYYYVNDREYYETFILHVNKEITSSPHSKKSKIIISGFSLAVILSLMYFTSFQLIIGNVGISTENNSLIVKIFELSDFERGMKQFEAEKYIKAKEFFQMVTMNDKDFPLAVEMIKRCDTKITEGFTEPGEDDLVEESSEQ